MNLENSITEALLLKAPGVALVYKENAKETLRRLKENLGDNLKGVYNSSLCHQFASIRPVISTTVVGQMVYEYSIDEARLEVKAEEYSRSAVLQWSEKIIAKVGDLQDVKVESLSPSSFVITGTRSGDSIRIEQQLIINCSRRGVLFNQFPALIYVNGKRTPEKKYQALYQS